MELWPTTWKPRNHNSLQPLQEIRYFIRPSLRGCLYALFFCLASAFHLARRRKFVWYCTLGFTFGLCIKTKPYDVPGLDQALKVQDLEESRNIYNMLPDDS
ncbi:hypothetical protein WAI453_013119 [Rhynchosporium graminicola]